MAKHENCRVVEKNKANNYVLVELIMKLTFAGFMLWQVLLNNRVLLWMTVCSFFSAILLSLRMKYMKSIEAKSMNSSSKEKSSELPDTNEKPREDVSELSTDAIQEEPVVEEEKKEEDVASRQRDALCLCLWRMRIGLVHLELRKLFPRAHLQESCMRQESVLARLLDRVIYPCRNPTGQILEDGAPRRVPVNFVQRSFVSPVFGDAFEVSSGLRQHATELQMMSIQVQRLKRMNENLELKVKYYRNCCVEHSNNNLAHQELYVRLANKVRDLEDKCSKLQEEKLILSSLLRATCALCKN